MPSTISASTTKALSAIIASIAGMYVVSLPNVVVRSSDEEAEVAPLAEGETLYVIFVYAVDPRIAAKSAEALFGSTMESSCTKGFPMLPDESKSPKSYTEYIERRTLSPISQSLEEGVRYDHKLQYRTTYN